MCCWGTWARFVVFFFSLFLLSEVSVVGLCCRLAHVRPRVSRCGLWRRGLWGSFVVFCTFLLLGVFCLVECAVDSDCSCWETPGRFLHHWRQFHQTGLARGRAPFSGQCVPSWSYLCRQIAASLPSSNTVKTKRHHGLISWYPSSACLWRDKLISICQYLQKLKGYGEARGA